MNIDKAAGLSQVIIDTGLLSYFMGAVIMVGLALLAVGFFILKFMHKWDKESVTYRTVTTMRIDEVQTQQQDHAEKIDDLHIRVTGVEKKVSLIDYKMSTH